MRSSYETFLKGGGRTGFVAVMGYEKYKREVDRMVRKSAGGRLQVKRCVQYAGRLFRNRQLYYRKHVPLCDLSGCQRNRHVGTTKY